LSFTFDATASSSSANSYASVSEFQDYVDSFLFSDDADALSSNHIQRALVMAFRIIETLRFNGSKTTTTQAAQFPRIGLTDHDGLTIGSSTIPTQLKHAQIELALYLLQTEERYVQEMMDYGQVSNYTSGTMAVAYNTARFANGLPSRVEDLLKDIGPNAWRKKNRNRRFGL